jgi:hypothetical protein
MNSVRDLPLAAAAEVMRSSMAFGTRRLMEVSLRARLGGAIEEAVMDGVLIHAYIFDLRICNVNTG